MILRTSWIFSPTGRNFVKTMLAQAAEQQSVRVVDDQHGSPTYAPHLVAAILELARQLSDRKDDKGSPQGPWGVYHAAGAGTTTWRGLAEEVFRCSAALGGPCAQVEPIKSADYPTPAERPVNSQLDCAKLERTFGVRLPAWQQGVAECVERCWRRPTRVGYHAPLAGILCGQRTDRRPVEPVAALRQQRQEAIAQQARQRQWYPQVFGGLRA